MATKVASLYAEISAKTDGFTSGLTSAKSQLGGFGSTLSSFTTMAAGAFSAAAIAAVAFSQALEFAEASAQIDQVTSSFNTLTTSLGQGPDLLNELQAATRGTVSELDLMVSTNQLLAGTTGQLGAAFAAAAPQLAAIAQAAHDLNPTMGTTAEMYDRLSRGIKKAEPELLDEVGILMNLTQVYKEYAAAIGVPVSALDKQQKSQAMLNAVLSQGSTLIEQAKGVNTEYADSVQRIQTALDNAGNSMKTKLAPAISNVATSIDLLINMNDQVVAALIEHEAQVGATAASYSEYESEMKRAANVANMVINANGDLAKKSGEVVRANFMMSESMYNSARATEAAAAAADAYAARLTGLAETYMDAEAATQAYSDRMTGLADHYAELETAQQQQILTAGLMAGIQGTLGNATEQYASTVSDLVQQEYELAAAIEEATAKYGENSTQVQELSQSMAENQAAQAGALSALQATTAEMMYQQAAAGLDAQASLDLARSMGVLSEADYAVATTIEAVRASFVGFADGALTAAEGADQFAAQVSAVYKAVASLQAKNMPVTIENIAKEMQQLAATQAPESIDELGKGADEAAPAVDAVASAAQAAAPAMEDAASAAKEQADAMKAIGAATQAASTISSLGAAARSAYGAIANAARAAEDLADAVSQLRSRNISISVSTSGFPEALNWISQLTAGLEGIPNSVTSTITLTTAGPTSQSSAPKVSMSTPAFETYYYETYNVYNPLAAEILASQKRQATAERMEALMHG